MLNKHDTILGTVTESRYNYCIVDSVDGNKLKCYAGLPVGMRGWFTVANYTINEQGTLYTAKLDSAIYDAA